MSDAKKPVAKVNLYPVFAAIWRNENTEHAVFYSVTLQRRYKDADGNWKNADSFNEGDLLLAAKVLDLAHTEVVKLRAADRQGQRAEDQLE